MKAWRVAIRGWDIKGIVAAETRGKAKYIVKSSGNDAGYQIKFPDINVRREPKYDKWAEKPFNASKFMDEKYITITVKSLNNTNEPKGDQCWGRIIERLKNMK